MIFLGKQVYNGCEPYIVAEISCNHGGDINRAFQLIEMAKWAKADAVKIQCYDADDLTINNGYVIGDGTPWSDKTLYELYQQAGTPLEWMAPLFNHASMCDIPMFSSVYSQRCLELLENIKCPAYKIASYEANDNIFVKKVADTGKPVIVSTGTLSNDEMVKVFNYLEPSQQENLILLHCVSQYPCDIEETGLGDLKYMQEVYTQPIGFSCHSDNPGAVLLAASLGAAMIELHVSLEDEQATKSPDWEFSYTPNMLKHTIEQAKKVKQALGPKSPLIETAASAFKRSLFVVKDLKKGDTLTEDAVKSFRPNLGCSPHLLPNIIGRKANRDITANTPMQMELLE